MSNFCFLFILLRSVSWAKFFYLFYAFVSPLWWKFFVVVDFFVYFRMFIILFMCSPCFKFLFVIIVFLWPFFTWDIYHSMNFCWNLYALTKNLCWNLFVCGLVSLIYGVLIFVYPECFSYSLLSVLNLYVNCVTCFTYLSLINFVYLLFVLLFAFYIVMF